MKEKSDMEKYLETYLNDLLSLSDDELEKELDKTDKKVLTQALKELGKELRSAQAAISADKENILWWTSCYKTAVTENEMLRTDVNNMQNWLGQKLNEVDKYKTIIDSAIAKCGDIKECAPVKKILQEEK